MSSLSSSTSSGIQGSLEEIDKSLKDVQDRREKLIKGTRDVVMLCSKSIVAMHHSQLEDAKSKMDQAKAMLEEFRKYAQQELVEAYALKSVMDDKPMPSMRELDVTGESYLTGLLDCVGEIKRLVYDRMRLGKGRDAEKLFATMEEIYNAVYPLAVYDNIVSGLRRKLDVARMLIEDIRATVTEESRRKALLEAVGAFEKRAAKEEEK